MFLATTSTQGSLPRTLRGTGPPVAMMPPLQGVGASLGRGLGALPHKRLGLGDLQGAWVFSASLAVFFLLKISLSLGTPSVTSLEETPAKWKVLGFIWVAGSPMLWAAMAQVTTWT